MTPERPDDAARERELARTAAEGDPAAQREIVDRLLNRVRNVARYVTGSDADADDAAQSAVLEILRSLGSFRGEGSLAAWATRIAARTALAFARRRRREPATADATTSAADDSGTALGGGIGEPVLRCRLARCLDRLPEERRETVVLRLVLGFTLEEIARKTGVSANTAKDRLRVGREELRKAILDDPVLRDFARKGMP